VEKTASDIPSPSDLTECCEETMNTANDTANIESSLDDAANKVTKNSLNDAANIDPDNSLDDYANKDTDTTLNHSSNVDSIKSLDDCTKLDTENASTSPSSIYHVKWVGWGKANTAIITQNENGPCPLLSIVNVLLLRGKLCLPPGSQVISAAQLLEYLGDLLLQLSPSSKDTKLDFQHNINDAISILPKLQTGLDVNVKFTGVTHFEYTEECLIFDLLNINLMHGWLVDSQSQEVAVAVNGLSYNQLVETIIRDRASSDSAKVSRALVAEQWLEESQSQLTYHGLCELNTTIKDEELVVFFRNNHFSTLHKTKDELFLLVTDQGFLDQSQVVWETLGNIEGDTEFVDSNFQSVKLDTTTESPGGTGSEPLSEDQRIEKDHALALALGREEEAARDRDKEWEKFKDHLGNNSGLTDEELAARLQEAENQAAAEEARREEAGQAVPGPSNPIGPRGGGPNTQPKKDKNCTIL